MLAGNLREFSLQDIFSLLTLTKKSGALRVTHDGQEGRVYFRHGEVFFAVSDVRRLALGARLVSAGLIDDAQLRRLLEAQRDTHGRVGQVLLDEGIVDEETLDTFVRDQVTDAVFNLMRLGEGQFSFDAVDEPGELVGAALTTEQLVIEGGRRLAEWDGIRQHVPSLDLVLAMPPLPPDGREQVALSAGEWHLLTMVNGQRTVRDIVELTGQGEYATCMVLARMVSTGVLEAVDPIDGASALAQMLARREMLRRLEESELGAPAAPAQPAPAQPAPAQPASGQPGLGQPAPAQPALVPPSPAVEPAPPGQPDHAEAPAPLDLPAQLPVEPATPSVPADAPVEASGPVDRFQVARELHSLGGEDKAAAPAARLTRDEDVNRGLLLRLIDGVKGA